MAAAALLALAGITVGVLLLRKRSPYLLVGWFWFIGMLAPLMGLVSIGSTLRTDRYTYIPLIGLSLLIAWGIPQLLQGRRYRQPILVTLVVIALVGCTARTWSQVAVWKDGKSVFAELLLLNRFDLKTLTLMGMEYEEEENYEEAASYYDEALLLIPSDYYARFHLAICFREMGALSKAEREYVLLTRMRPDFAPAFLGLGLTQSRMGKLEYAERSLEEALRLRPDYSDAKRELEVVRRRKAQ